MTGSSLRDNGWTRDAVQAQLDARRWTRHGRAIVAHNGALSWAEQLQVALINCGPRSVLTSFTATEEQGLQGWHRDQIHVLVAAGSRLSPDLDVSVRVHYARTWSDVRRLAARPIQRLPDAVLVAAGSFPTPRPAIGIVAASVQQRLTRPDELRTALQAASRLRHRRILAACIDDIEQGSEALSEIDFDSLCRRARLPLPRRQAVRVEPSGRRRYLDGEWDLPDGRTLVAEVDGALHLAAQRWYDDQLRQNEIVLSGALVLRFPSVVIRTEPKLVIAQLRRALA